MALVWHSYHRSYKKKCQGRLRKHLADFCLQAGLPGEAMLHYNTALDILKPVNDWLWMGACYEGLCAASVIVTYPRSQGPSLRRNQSFSVRSTTVIDGKGRTGSIKHSYANGLQDLPESVVRTSLEQDDIIEKYKEALMYYSKYKNAAPIEIEASFKACRVLVTMKHLINYQQIGSLIPRHKVYKSDPDV
ncbi:hypothetical protein CHS0354_030672 [Potamilus streckersoni]|uniref:Trs120/TRAPPC9 N-terminal domain-containing protein n=1 Tax=Potamilus streckersoni TaxID=2493646 RepID=A0AAE0SUW7_9BIVA|nr:hypothetical protein CHS0354_030672 [Potamilus streckersoni]